MERKATAVWKGDLKTGKGTLTTDSGTLQEAPYNFQMRFENEKGTNPEELLAAAHAGCFTMALAAELGKEGIVPSKLQTTGTVSLASQKDGFSITKSHLSLTAEIPGVDQEKFDKALQSAKTGCPVSKLFKAEITVSVKFNQPITK